MKRVNELLKYADLSGKGMEVAPYFNPTLPKRDGNDVLILDVFDTERLRLLAKMDKDIPNERIHEIEDVDFVGDACQIGQVVREESLAGKLSYIISSHNFEHLPNPILFLQGCSDALKEGGVLSMAVPDYRACYDFFRMPTRLSDWLLAYHQNFKQPPEHIIFDSVSMSSRYLKDGKSMTGCDIHKDDPGKFTSNHDLVTAYRDYQSSLLSNRAYTDVHCSVVFPELLELLLRDLRKIGLIDLDVLEISKTQGGEFFVHLSKSKSGFLDDDTFYDIRDKLLVSVSGNMGSAPYKICLSTASIRRMRSLFRKMRNVVKNRKKKDNA